MNPEHPAAIRVLIADDEAELRAALADLITSEDSLELVGTARDAGEVVELARTNQPDVALVDVKMPGGGATATRGILETSPRTRVIALSAYEDRTTVMEMLGAGAAGYLVKGTSPEEIVRAITRVVGGQTSVSSEVIGSVVQELSVQLRKETQHSEELRGRRERIERAVTGEGLSLVYQPIWELAAHRIVGHEALARFSAEPVRGPDVWFAEAAELGLIAQLELFAIGSALADLPRLPDDTYVSLNLSHRTAMSPELLDVVAGIDRGRLVFEITEHEAVEDYGALGEALARLREGGGRVAIDDAGAGFASLRHTLRLAPDIIKLDISITAGIDADRARRALARALITFADEMAMTIVAEGIETQAELDALLALGVGYGQGFFLARPAPLP
jgi:EAL domain-containing protein (putative c-di-GMP-specific phosphodiesterase class I)/CheY-like chemotaxis protein